MFWKLLIMLMFPNYLFYQRIKSGKIFEYNFKVTVMKINQQFNSINEFHKFSNLPKPEHPLISLIDYSLVHYPDEYSKDRKSTRLNSSHVKISYAVFCLKKKKKSIEV